MPGRAGGRRGRIPCSRPRHESGPDGREDAGDRDSYDPARHRWYRNGDRGYERIYGPRDFYENAYRDGFRQGYDRGYRDFGRYPQDRRRGGLFLYWPF